MNWLFAYGFMGLVAGLVIWGALRPGRIYQLPFLAGVMTFSFLLPQIPALADDDFLPQGAFVRTMVFGSLCLIALFLAWPKRPRTLRFLEGSFDEGRLLAVSAAFSLIGAVFYFRLSHLPGEEIVGVQMSGASVMYLFFARLLSYGLAIAALLFARRPSKLAFLIIVFGVVFYIDRIVVTGKRAEAVELALMLLLPLWFYRRWAPPVTLVLATVVAGTFLMNSMSDYRNITRESGVAPAWSEIANINFVENFEQTLRFGGPEMRNAVTRIQMTNTSMEFDYGKFHWNTLVFNYVPAQLVGSTVKEALMLELPEQSRNYDKATGTTETGLADAFQSFWYLGFVKFMLLSAVAGRIWFTAMRGSVAAQIVYVFTAVPAMHAVSHHTDWVVSAWVHMAIFLLPALLFARVRRKRRAPAAHPEPAPALITV
jgi:hypothetical protein